MSQVETLKRDTAPEEGLEHIGKRAGFESQVLRVPIGLVPFFDEVIRLYKLSGMRAANERLKQASTILTAFNSKDVA
ncbi:hypothetical protein N836_35765 [Leptolyngbya sp. Heron Island J]|uniref:hypothetical protein n=1 Tax=Leptolyngbya sp. Heron Island J TaxID=1385935 RepID=UPI0003B971F2|nr:hypothetical protein [Leptolyngbya sp. Heron Island J]ESA37732.1 hypothetical protein N836_35765 [Leptolyngbya sp. Heron Island J]